MTDLRECMEDFLRADSYRLWVEPGESPSEYWVKYETKPLPAAVPLLIGDIVHNLHVPLDHIASEIVNRHRGGAGRLHFPTNVTRELVAKSKHLERIAEAAPKLRDVILDQVRPYKTDNYALWALGKLDNVDKHRLLIPTLGITEPKEISAVDDHGNGVRDITLEFGANQSFNLAGFYSPCRITNTGKPTFSFAFSQGTYFEGHPVMPTSH